MKKQISYSLISVLAALVVLVVLFSGITFSMSDSYVTGLAGMPRRYYSYETISIHHSPYTAFQFLCIAMLYITLQFFVFANIKKCYQKLTRIRVIIYMFCTAVTTPVVVIPYLWFHVRTLFVGSLNPFLNYMLFLPVCFQMWLWIDMMIRMAFGQVGGGKTVAE